MRTGVEAASVIALVWFAGAVLYSWVRGLGDPWTAGPWDTVKTLKSGTTELCPSCRPGGFALRGDIEWDTMPGLRVLRGPALLRAVDQQLAALRQEHDSWVRGSQDTARASSATSPRSAASARSSRR